MLVLTTECLPKVTSPSLCENKEQLKTGEKCVLGDVLEYFHSRCFFPQEQTKVKLIKNGEKRFCAIKNAFT